LFTSIAVLSLALAIGANTAVFTLLDQLVLRLLPVQDPERLVMIWSTSPHIGYNIGPRSASYPIYQDFERKPRLSNLYSAVLRLPRLSLSTETPNELTQNWFRGVSFRLCVSGQPLDEYSHRSG
jgi:hypothetical protein